MANNSTASTSMFKSAANKVKVGAKIAAPARLPAPAELKEKLKKLSPEQRADLFFKVYLVHCIPGVCPLRPHQPTMPPRYHAATLSRRAAPRFCPDVPPPPPTTCTLQQRQIQNDLKAAKKKNKLLEKEVSWAQHALLYPASPPTPPLDRSIPNSTHPPTHTIPPRRRQLYVEIKLRPIDSKGQPIRFGWDRHRETCEILSTTMGGQADMAGKLLCVEYDRR